MKKTWKQLIAIVCMLSMIACMLPAVTLAEGVATPTDLAPVTEPVQVEEPAEEPAEDPAEEPAAEPAEEPAAEPAAEPAEEPAAEPEEEEAVAKNARIAVAERDGKIFLTAIVEPEIVGPVTWEMKLPWQEEDKWVVIESVDQVIVIEVNEVYAGREIRFRLEDGTKPFLKYLVPQMPVEEPTEEEPAEPAEELPEEEPTAEEEPEEPAEELTEEEPAAEEEPEEPAEELTEEEPAAEEEPEEPAEELTEEEPAAEEEPKEPAEELTEEEPAAEEEPKEPAEELTEENPEEETCDEEEIEDYQTPLGLISIPEEDLIGEEPAGEEAVDDLEIAIIEEADPEEIVENAEEPVEEEPVVIYVYERDENGELVLDENGNPIVTVIGDGEIPVTYQRDENGELVLDENGDPIPTQTLPADAVIISSIEDALNPDRTIDIYYSWNNMEPALGVEVTFIAILYGYDNLEYNVQWQQSKNGSEWTDVPGSVELRHSETITRDHYKDFWRVQVMITGIEE